MGRKKGSMKNILTVGKKVKGMSGRMKEKKKKCVCIRHCVKSKKREEMKK